MRGTTPYCAAVDLWAIVVSAVIGALTVVGAYFGARKGADATIEAAKITNQTAHVANLIAIAQQLRESGKPELEGAAYRLLLAAAEAMGNMEDAPSLIQGVTRGADLQQAIEQARTLAAQTGQDPDVEYPESGGYL